MQKKMISKTGLEVSAIGLGCMGMSEFYGATDEQESKETLTLAVEKGITHFDTADMYGFGRNELLLGSALRPFCDKLIIATKSGIVRDEKDPRVRGVNGKPTYLKAACEASLKRLGVDTIDLYYLHRLDAETPIEDTMGAMSDLIREGKIRFIGLSEVNAEIIQRAHAVHPLTTIQSEYSLWNRGPEKEIIPLCKTLGIGFVAYSPLGRGFLTGKIASTDSLAPGDFRRHLPRFQEENLQHNLVIVQAVEKLAKTKQCTAAQIALAWVLAQGEHVTAIPGTKRRRYLEENIQALNIKLSPEEITHLNQAAPLGAAVGARYTADAMKAYNFEE